MGIITEESMFEYQMKGIVLDFKIQYDDLIELSGEELQTKIWKDYAKEFGQLVLEHMNEFSGDELFE